MAQPHNYLVVLNINSIEAGEHELMPGFILRRAIAPEIARIKPHLETATPLEVLESAYEYEWIKDGTDTEVNTPLPHDRYRYFVISFEQSPEQIREKLIIIQKTALLLKPSLSLGPTHMPGEKGHQISWDIVSLFHSLPNYSFRSTRGFFVDLNAKDIERFRHIAKLWENYNHNFDLNRRMSMFAGIRLLHQQSEFVSLAYFSIIESILTHKPDSKDPYDSILRQIKKKFPFLRKRFDTPFDYACFDKSAKEETVWDRLYDYRSYLAHGSEIKFDDKLKLLRNAETVRIFLHDATRSLLFKALQDPELVSDLHEC